MCVDIDMPRKFLCTNINPEGWSWQILANSKSDDLDAHRWITQSLDTLCAHRHTYVHVIRLNSECRDLKSCIWAFPHLPDKPIPRGQVSRWKQLWHQEPMPWERPCLFSHHHPGTPPPSPAQPPRFQATHQSEREKPGTQLGCSWNPIDFLSQFFRI